MLRGKESTCQCRRCRLDPWVGKTPYRRKCSPLQYSCLRNRMDRGACWATAHGVIKSWTQLSNSTRRAVLTKYRKLDSLSNRNILAPSSAWRVGLFSSNDLKRKSLVYVSPLASSSLLPTFDISWHVEASFWFLSLSSHGVLHVCLSLPKVSLSMEGHQVYWISIHARYT